MPRQSGKMPPASCHGFQKKLRPAPGGGLAARDPVWDGEGWGCDRVACPVVSLSLLVIAGAGGGGRGTAVAMRNPDILVALRLPLDEAVSGLGPGHDVFVLHSCGNAIIPGTIQRE